MIGDDVLKNTAQSPAVANHSSGLCQDLAKVADLHYTLACVYR